MQKSVTHITYFGLILFFLSAYARDESDAPINIAVMDLQAHSGISKEEALSITDRLRGELIRTDKFVVLERDQVDEILQEQGFQQTGACSEASCIVEIGQLLAVHYMVGGSIGKVGKAFSVNLRLIRVESGKVEKHISRDYTGSKEKLITTVMREMAREMAGLPPIDPKKRRRIVLFTSVPAIAVGAGVAAFLVYRNSQDDVTGENATGTVTFQWSDE
jgi:TolB-like protein